MGNLHSNNSMFSPFKGRTSLVKSTLVTKIISLFYYKRQAPCAKIFVAKPQTYKTQQQAFADRAADDFGITQREVLERTGLSINAENAPRTFDDGSRINENSEFVDANGNVLFQSAMYRNKRTDIKEFTQFVLDNPNNKKSYQKGYIK